MLNKILVILNKEDELIFKKLKEVLNDENVVILPVDYAPASFQTIVTGL